VDVSDFRSLISERHSLIDQSLERESHHTHTQTQTHTHTHTHDQYQQALQLVHLTPVKGQQI